MIAFKSFGSGLDGIGLACDPISKNYNTTTHYIWFENGLMKLIKIQGYAIVWPVSSYSYSEIGTNEIRLQRPKTVDRKEWKNIIDRKTLIMKNKAHSWNCSIAYSKEELDKIIYQVIDDAQSTNKI